MLKSLIVIALLSVTSSCVGIIAGAAVAVGYIQYTENEAFLDFQGADLDTTWRATLRGLQDMDYTVDGNYPHEATYGEIDLDERDTNVKVEIHPEGFTRVRVRVGTFETKDNIRKAELILSAIEKRM